MHQPRHVCRRRGACLHRERGDGSKFLTRNFSKKRIAAAEYGLKMYTTKIYRPYLRNFASTSEKCPIQKGSGLEETAKFDLRRARSSDDQPIVSLPKSAKERISIDRVLRDWAEWCMQVLIDRTAPTARQSPHVARGGLSKPAIGRAAPPRPLCAAHRLGRALKPDGYAFDQARSLRAAGNLNAYGTPSSP
jgi:hypothetical protein